MASGAPAAVKADLQTLATATQKFQAALTAAGIDFSNPSTYSDPQRRRRSSKPEATSRRAAQRKRSTASERTSTGSARARGNRRTDPAYARPVSKGRHRVLVVGAGFGGLACARKLDGEPVDVLVLDRHNYHLFTPLLYQVATSLLNPSDIAYPLRAIFRRSRNVRFRQAAVSDVDPERKVVRTVHGEEFGYDSLVLATGSTNNYFANESLAHHTLGMKTLAEAMRLRNHVLSCLELAARADTAEERRDWLTFVVVGGGPTGVEYAGALAELLRLVLGRDYPELDPALARIVIVEGLDRLLGTFHPKLGAYAARRAEGARHRGADGDAGREQPATMTSCCAAATRSAAARSSGRPASGPPTRSARKPPSAAARSGIAVDDAPSPAGSPTAST